MAYKLLITSLGSEYLLIWVANDSINPKNVR